VAVKALGRPLATGAKLLELLAAQPSPECALRAGNLKRREAGEPARVTGTKVLFLPDSLGFEELVHNGGIRVASFVFI